jgi:hypothetical protein
MLCRSEQTRQALEQQRIHDTFRSDVRGKLSVRKRTPLYRCVSFGRFPSRWTSLCDPQRRTLQNVALHSGSILNAAYDALPYQLRIQRQRIHVRELSGDPKQQKQAQGQLAAMVTGLDKLRDYRKLFS